MTYAAEVLADAPVVFWRLGEPSGTVAADTSGNAHAGTYGGTVGLGTTGLLTGDANTAVAFDGTGDDQYVKSGDDLGNTTYPAFTLECWVKLNVNTVGQGLIGIIDVTYDHWISIHVSGISGGNPTLSFDFGGTGGPGAGPTATVTTGAVHHLVFTYDGTTAKVYVDGALVGSTTPGVGDADFAGFAAHLYAGGDDLGFGDGAFATVDEAAFYDYALSAARVGVHHSVGTGAGGGGGLDPTLTLPADWQYTVDVVNKAGAVVTTLTKANVISITRTKNEPMQAEVSFPKHAYSRADVHIFADDSGSGNLHEIRITRNGDVRFWGPAVAADTSSDNETVTLHCRGVDWYLWHLFLDAQRTNLLTNPSFETGDATGWSSSAGLTTDEVTTADAIRGIYSLHLASSTALGDTFKEQTFNVTGTGIGTFLTVVFYFKLGSITGHNLDRRGLYVEAREAGVFKTNNYYAIDEATPVGHWIRAKTTIAVPPLTTWAINVRLYSPPGSIRWDDGEVVAMQSISTASLTGNIHQRVDVSEIVGLIHTFVQNPSVGKFDLNIDLDNPTVGVEQVKHIQWADHIAWSDQMSEWLERFDCFDYSMRYTNTARTLVLHVPQQGTDRRASVTLAFPGNVGRYTYSEDGGGCITDDTVLDDASGAGPDREEGHFADASLVGGLVLQNIESAPPKSEPSSLTPIARDKVDRNRRPARLYTLTLRGGDLHSGTPYDELLGVWDAVNVTVDNGWDSASGFGRIAQLVEYPRDRKLEVSMALAIPS